MADVTVRFVGDATSAIAATKQLESSLGGLKTEATSTSAKLTGVATALAAKTVAVASTGLVGLAGAVAFAGIRFDDLKQRATNSFTALLGSADQAKKMINDLATFARTTPFEFPQVISLSQQLLAAGFGAKQLIPTMTSLGDAVSALGGDPAKLDHIVLAFQQIKAAGRLMSGDLRQLSTQGLPAVQILATELGTTQANVMKMITKGQIDSTTAINALIDGINKRYGGLMQQQNQTFSGLLSNMKDLFGQVSGEIMGPTFELIVNGLKKINTETTVGRAGIDAWATSFGQTLASNVKSVFEWFVQHWPQITSIISDAWSMTKLLGGVLLTLVGDVNSVVGAVGGWKTALEFLLAGTLALRILDVAKAIRANLIAQGFAELRVATKAEQDAYVEAFGVMEVATLGLSATIKAALVTTGIGALIVAAGLAAEYVITHWSQVKTFVGELGAFIANTFDAAWDAVKGAAQLAIYGMLVDISELAKGLSSALGWIPGLGGKIKAAMNEVSSFIDSFRDNGIADMKSAGEKMGSAWGDAFTAQVQGAVMSVQQSLAQDTFKAAGGIPLDVPKNSPLSAGAPAGKAKLLALAKQAIGTPYLWGGSAPGGFDCSGLVMWAFANGLNIDLPRTTDEQAQTGIQVKPSSAQVGNLVFTQPGEVEAGVKHTWGHVGLIVGFTKDGQPIIESAPGSGKTVHTTTGFSAFAGGGAYMVRDVAVTPQAAAAANDTTAPNIPSAADLAKKAAGGKAKKPTIVSGSKLIDQDTQDAIDAFASSAKNAGSKSLTASYLMSEEKELEAARSEVEARMKSDSGKQLDADKAEVTKLTGKIKDVGTAIQKALVVTGDALLPQSMKTAVTAAANQAAQALRTAQALTTDATTKQITDSWQAVVDSYKDEEGELEREKKLLQSKLAGASTYQRAAIKAEIAKINGQIGDVQKAVSSALASEESALESKVSALQSSVQSTWSAVQGDIISQFETQTNALVKQLGDKYFQNGQLTPSEQLLANMQAEDTAGNLQDAVDTAQKQLDVDKASVDVTADQLAADEKALDQARRQQEENEVSIKATAERAQADKDYAAELAKLQADRAEEERELTDVLSRFGDQVAKTGDFDLAGLQAALDGANVYGTAFGITLSDLALDGVPSVQQNFADLQTQVESLAQAMADLQAVIDKITGQSSGGGGGGGGGGGDGGGGPRATSPSSAAIDAYRAATLAIAQATGNVYTHGAQPFATGGRVPGPSIGPEDTVLARLSGGEEVLDRSLSKQLRRALASGGGISGGVTVVQATVLGGTERQVGAALERLVTPAQARVVSYSAPR